MRRTLVTLTFEVYVDTSKADALPAWPGNSIGEDTEPPTPGLVVHSELLLNDLSRSIHERWCDKLGAVMYYQTATVGGTADLSW